jgi:hypothetical protein
MPFGGAHALDGRGERPLIWLRALARRPRNAQSYADGDYSWWAWGVSATASHRSVRAEPPVQTTM